MSIILNKNLAECLAEGSAIYGCGGGLEMKTNKEKSAKIAQDKRIIIKSLNEFKKNDILAVVSGIGKPPKQKIDFGNALKAGIDYISKILPNKKLSGIVPGEIGIESLVIELAGALNLPILDGDIAGGRAVPEIQDDIFYINRIKTTPAVCVNLQGEVLIIDNTSNLAKIENIVRNFVALSAGPAILIDHITNRDNFGKISLGTFSRSIELGKIIKNKTGEESLKEILKFNNAKIVAEGKILSVEEEKSEGFLKKIVTGADWKTIVKNEYLAIYKDNRLISSIPDIIVLIEKESGKPLHNTGLKKGKNVWIISMKSFSKWYTKRGLEIFGPKSIDN